MGDSLFFGLGESTKLATSVLSQKPDAKTLTIFLCALDRRASASLDELTLSRAAIELVARDQNASAREHDIGHAGHLDALEHGIVHAHVMSLGAYGVLALGIEDDEVGVTAHRNRPLAGIDADECGR